MFFIKAVEVNMPDHQPTDDFKRLVFANQGKFKTKNEKIRRIYNNL